MTMTTKASSRRPAPALVWAFCAAALLTSACAESTVEPLVDLADIESAPIDASLVDSGPVVAVPDADELDANAPTAAAIGDVDTGPDVEPSMPVLDEPTAEPGASDVQEKRPWKNEDGVWVVTFDMLGSFLYLPPGTDPRTITIGHHATGDDPYIPSTASPTSPVPGEEEVDPEPEPPTRTEEEAKSLLANYLVVTKLEELPDWINELVGKKVEVEGFMVPIEFEDGLVREFVLSRYVGGCCFGMLPAPNELVDVTMVSEEGADYESYLPIVVEGTFHITENAEPGYLQGLFRLESTKVRVAPPR